MIDRISIELEQPVDVKEATEIARHLESALKSSHVKFSNIEMWELPEYV